MIIKVLYYENIKIEINILLYQQNPRIFTECLDKCFSLLPKKIYQDSVNKIIIGFSKKLKGTNKTATYQDGTIYITEAFLGYEKPEKKLLKELFHEMGHAFIYSFQDELFYDDKIYYDFYNLKNKVAQVIPDFQRFVKIHNDRQGVDNFIRNEYGEGEFHSKTIDFLPSPYTILEADEFIVYFFEEYYLRYKENVEKHNPVLYKILESL